MVQLTIRLTVKTGQVEPTVRALRNTMRGAMLNGSCANAHIAADVNDTDTFWYSEEWQDVGELESQMRSERFSQLLSLVETGVQPPLLEFRVVETARGLEYIAAVREAAAAESGAAGRGPDETSHVERSRE
jgi:quinol monooxygenase YgiN